MPDGPSFGRSSGKRTTRASGRSPAQSPQIDTLKVGELKARLQDARLSTQGNKAELRARLEAGDGGPNLGKVVALVDVSGSMGGTPMDVALAMHAPTPAHAQSRLV